MSLTSFAGSAQSAAVGTLASRGGASAALCAGLLMNVRFIPTGLAVSQDLPGGRIRRALVGQAVVDASWALARRNDRDFDWRVLVGASIPQAIGWWAGTAIGAYGGRFVLDPNAFGLDAVFPAFFLALPFAGGGR